MSRRVGIVLSGCGYQDGSEIREAVFTLLSLERANARVIFAAPDVPQTVVANHFANHSGGDDTGKTEAPRRVLAESARIARGDIRPLADLQVDDVDALIFPGGYGVGLVLSNYAEKGALCDVDPDVSRLLRGML